MLLGVGLFASVGFVACGNDLSTAIGAGTGGNVIIPSNRCDDLAAPPDGCGEVCADSDLDCALGTFCLDGVCAAQCSDGSDCPGNADCTDRGRCVTQSSGTGATGGSNENCEPQPITPGRITPNVLFIVDQSYSMRDAFGGGKNRWEAAHDAISQIVSETQGIVRVGLVTYTAKNDGNDHPVGECPRLRETSLAFDIMSISDNLASYPRTYPTDLGTETPTGDAIEAILDRLEINPPPKTDPDDPTILVLATDGEPDRCELLNPDSPAEALAAKNEAIDAVQRALSLGFKTYALSVGDDVGEQHLKDLAVAGGTRNPSAPSNSSEGFYQATSPDALVTAFRGIVNSQVSCEVPLNASLENAEDLCRGDVKLDGVALTCGVDFELKAGTLNTIVLLDSDPTNACSTWKSNAGSLTAVSMRRWVDPRVTDETIK
ncbi:MAG: VWA domain-containing protein [Polyangiales bacterium]